jgi:hypothetical protein
VSWYADVDLPWHIYYEHRLSFAYHWTPLEIDCIAATECLGHMILIKRREATDKQMSCMSSSYAKLDRSARKRIDEALRDEMQTGRRRRSEFEVADPADRITMIGRAVRIHGERWCITHPTEMNWLKSQRISQEEAIRLSVEWDEREAQDDFWK